jgi:hypothetical protein
MIEFRKISAFLPRAPTRLCEFNDVGHEMGRLPTIRGCPLL